MTQAHRHKARSKRVVVPASIALLAVTGVTVLTSGALFTDRAEVGTNAFTAGTVELSTNPTEAVFNAPNMAPGDVVTSPLVVKNTGSLALRYAMESLTVGDLATALTFQTKTGVTDCTTAGFAATGTSLYGPATPASSNQAVRMFGNKNTGPDQGDRVLAPNAQETLCVQVTLPKSTGNDYQAKTAATTFNFYAEQTKNNGLVIANPAVNGQAQSLLQTALTPDGTGATVAWPTSNDERVTGYVLSRTANSGTTWVTIATINDRSTSQFTDTGLGQGTTYGYALQAVGFDGTITPLPQNMAQVSTVTTPWLVPAAASTVVAAISDTAVAVTWTKSRDAWVTGYRIRRSVDTGTTWTTLGTTGGSATSYTDTTVAPGGSYTYKVVAIGADGTTTSADSNTSTVALRYSFTQVNSLGAVAGITRGNDGNLYVTNRGGNLLKINQAGTTSTYATGLGLAYGVLQTADGSFYVADSYGGVLRKVSPTGVVTTFASGLGYPQGLARGTDGNFYVADSTGGRLFRVTPAGAVSTVATGLGSPYGVATGDNGSLYVTDYAGGRLLKVVPNGAVTTITTGLVGPHGVERGTDGNIYVANFGNGMDGNLVRVAPNGVKTVLPGTPGGLSDVAEGIDGNFYVVDYNGGGPLGRMFRILR